jgi:hypothetical protein
MSLIRLRSPIRLLIEWSQVRVLLGEPQNQWLIAISRDRDLLENRLCRHPVVTAHQRSKAKVSRRNTGECRRPAPSPCRRQSAK